MSENVENLVSKLTPREKADLAMRWTLVHVANPCGNTPEEREFMRKRHIGVVCDALKEPGVRNTLSETEKMILEDLGVNEKEQKKVG